MGKIFEEWSNDLKIRVIVLRDAGDKCFCAGNDISEFSTLRSSPEQVDAYNAIVRKAYELIRNSPKPSIAQIAGSCSSSVMQFTSCR